MVYWGHQNEKTGFTMMEIETVVKQPHDVIVVGGGIGGVCAAVAASRMGARTLLIEKSINLGGLATRGRIEASCRPVPKSCREVP